MRYQNVGSMFFLFVTKHACVGRTDRQTQNYDPEDRASIAASRGKNVCRWCGHDLSIDMVEHVNILYRERHNFV